MTLYRKLGEYNKELKIINDGIKVFEQPFIDKQKATNKTIARLSKSIASATGLTDKKGRQIYTVQLLAKWIKRKELLKKRISKNTHK